ncbi:unnamed protein product [Periconia digitata]|uniref:Carrier domain-containing protein n=1 Tax=Periconia digitata TaxID=1303443 RepID=A0A9W4U2A0_9PLEO|nr:unnamed protein product [Periconia digitata]
MAAWETWQDLFRERANAEIQQSLFFYPLGNTRNPMEITYASLYHEAKQISHTIQSLKHFKLGHPVLLHCDDHRDLVLCFWSVLFAGGVPVLSSPFSNIEEERQKSIQSLSTLLESPVCITRSRALPLFGETHGLYMQTIERLLEKTKQPPRSDSIIGETTEDAPDSPYIQKQDVPSAEPMTEDERFNLSNGVETHNSHGGDLMMLMLTSGSTGNAKAVEFTQDQIMAAVSGKASMRDRPRDKPFLNWIGMDHVAGLIEIHLQAMWLGVGQVHVSAVDVITSPTTGFLDLLSRHQVSSTFAPNFFLAKLVATIETLQTVPEWDLSSLVCVTSGGEANDIKICIAASKLFARFGAPQGVLMVGFGMTETCAGSIYNTDCPEYDISCGHEVASLGKCTTGAKMRIVTPGGEQAATGQSGDLEVSGPAVFKRYYRNPTATAESFTSDGWFRTGDRGLIDVHGNLSLLGRTKEVININGVKIVASDVQTAIENVLGDLVTRLVVFPTKALHTEQVTVAYIPKLFPIPDEDMAGISKLVTQACLIRTSTKPIVFAILEESIPIVPMSTLGKISRLKMTRLFEDGKFAADFEAHQQAMRRASEAAKSGDRNDLDPKNKMEAKLLEHIAEVLEATPDMLDIHPEASLFDIGFTSMHVIKLKWIIDKYLGVDVPVILIMRNPTIRSLAVDIEAHLQRSKDVTDQPATRDTYDPVVVFRPDGSKTPLWLFHPGVGEVLVFIGLAQCLATDDRPVYALRAAGFEPGHKRFESIKQAVDVYTAAIRKRQPHGPYAMAGYSYGTMLAFETAKVLGAAGEEVRFLGSFNLPPHIKQRISTLEWNVCLLHLSHFLSLITEDTSDMYEVDGAYRDLSRTDAIRTVYDIANKSRWDELRLETAALTRWVDVAFGLQAMASTYDPSGEVKNMDVFHCIPLRAVAESREIWMKDHISRWAEFVKGSLQFHSVQGEHYTMIDADHVNGFAQTLMKVLKARAV